MSDFSQTVYLVLGAVIYQGIYLMIPDTHPKARQIGAALAAGGTIAAIIYSRGGLSASAFSLSVFSVYCAVALVVSVALAVLPFSEFMLRRDAQRLATELEDWSILASAKLPRFVAAGRRSPEEIQLEAEYKDKFGPRIVQLMKPLVEGESAYRDLRDTWLRVPSKDSSSVALTAHLASLFFAKYRNELPIPVPKVWLTKASLKFVAIYFASALALWSALFAVEELQPMPQVANSPVAMKPAESAYSDMNNATLKEITIEHVKEIRALRERTDESINVSNLNNLGSLNHQEWIADQFKIEMWRYRSKYLAKSTTLMLELRKREPDYLLEMDAQRVDDLDRTYRDPFIPQDLDKVADDLNTMALHLPADAPR